MLFDLFLFGWHWKQCSIFHGKITVGKCRRIHFNQFQLSECYCEFSYSIWWNLCQADKLPIITSVIFRSYRLGKIRGKTERETRECEWVKNKLSKFVDCRLVFAFNSFDNAWKIVWLTRNGFFFNGNVIHSQILSHWRKSLTEVSMRKLNGVQQLRWSDGQTLLPDKKPKTQKPRKVYKQRPAKCVLKQDSSGDLSSSEKSEETLFKSEEEDTDYY